ncbi:IMPACT family protein [Acinetobacter pollinis]|uniref:YigZ family protein n=1 Tax=Acinetobacter pollinis TaxID=2605270 RepID=A0ABU6DUR2_9GAMM|nr:YigZ family protein [Acinetobacter pollinis]MBF7690278.1 YigZ family protein [Acinetobacter pollinis]MBF7692895.1 YigZ family protein [Acinetobacter pollinis]MBF7697866.1 YigZ family protein [Acinetobacter pollinis]MBF7700526.1 YigZ family protein [Acinetobacter pollinis]MEB5477475.1 YigZ family protein [Acinetobacter pollinis]
MPFTIKETVVYEEDVKKSRFQAFAIPVETEEEIKTVLETYKDISTTHQCWAWKIGHNVRFNDDGEPSGTAGRPILATIEGNELTNILVLVNRWYGGVKLGTGGLVRAYGGTAGKALLLVDKIELIEKIDVYFECNFSEWPILQYELVQNQITFSEEYTATGVSVNAKIQIHQRIELAKKVQDVTRGREELKGTHDD